MTFMPFALSCALLLTGAAQWCLSIQKDLDARIEVDRDLGSLASDTARSLESLLTKNRSLDFIEGLCLGTLALGQPTVAVNLRKVARAIAYAQDLEWRLMQAQIYYRSLRYLPKIPKLFSPDRSPKRICTPGPLVWEDGEVLELQAWREIAGIAVEIDEDTQPAWRYRHPDLRRRLGP